MLREAAMLREATMARDEAAMAREAAMTREAAMVREPGGAGGGPGGFGTSSQGSALPYPSTGGAGRHPVAGRHSASDFVVE